MKANLKFFISFVLIFSIGLFIFTGFLNLYFRNHAIWSYKTDNAVYSVAISSDGSYIVAGTYTSYYFFSNSNSKPLWSYKIENNSTSAHLIDLVISQDGSYAAGTFFKTLYMFSNTNSVPLWNFTSSSPFSSLDMSLDGSYIAVTKASTLYLFSKSSNVPLWRFSSGNGFSSAIISSNGSYVTAVDSKNLYFFSKSSNQSLGIYPMNPDGKRYSKHIAMSPDARYIGLIDRQFDGTHTDSFLYIFETTNLTPIWSKKFNDQYLFSIAISYNGSYIAVSGSSGSEHTLYFFTKLNNKPLWTFPLKWELSKLSMSYYGSYLAVASAKPSFSLGFSESPSKGVVYLFHKDNPKPEWSYSISAFIPTIAISFDGRSIIAGVDDNIYFLK